MESTVRLQPMKPMYDAVIHDENWTGMTDAKVRRRLQNRLNQRARRRRKEQYVASTFLMQSRGNHIPAGMLSRSPIITNAEILPFALPLSVDHLLSLVQFNVFRALVTNMTILSLPDVFICDEPNIKVSALPLPNHIPPALMPTALQRSVFHHSWMDIFPLPALRDNLICLQGRFDFCDLCDDVVGAMWDDQLEPHDERNGLVVWGEPWDIKSWEVMEGFLKKWGWVLTGCNELIESTNRWRQLRGEKPFLYSDIPVEPF
ncbi:hypothetical protein BGW36DRAFT_382442 [Talaromyces proteolyticus]|uniref:BZIP domain-containing protein n=1 Tax=Talaromyces proteolyticus TaxID=1131652 RepID=A0AAD4KN68_9EURO|nr:uncharacterized protein BGW36DRAFT_382442 [Talaromyces proteolyticus]KAH8695289.1 hypothetical protein BGW36DRAFT_382442 [Talaromyces proteolyticus]